MLKITKALGFLSLIAIFIMLLVLKGCFVTTRSADYLICLDVTFSNFQALDIKVNNLAKKMQFDANSSHMFLSDKTERTPMTRGVGNLSNSHTILYRIELHNNLFSGAIAGSIMRKGSSFIEEERENVVYEQSGENRISKVVLSLYKKSATKDEFRKIKETFTDEFSDWPQTKCME